GIAPGTVLWPDGGRFADEALREKITAAIPLGRVGSPEDVAAAVVFLARSPFLTGIVVPVDGGRLAAGAGE
ncbi:MAG TPA: SDR family oxidoreductase, partial [Nannocystaceae bacterium]|nr:SDR family oxidoreductase [Nannocystaceae bacterium]